MATTVRERALQAAKSGYSISESVLYCRFEIRKPDGTVYFITNDRCNCPATKPCKHVELLSIARAYWLALDRKPIRPIRARRTFSARHLAAFRLLSPAMPPVPRSGRASRPCPKPAPSAEYLEQRAKMEARIVADFGPAQPTTGRVANWDF